MNNPKFKSSFKKKSTLSDSDKLIFEQIQRKRLQMLIWSRMYYMLDVSIVSDSDWSKVAQELKELQETYPKVSKMVCYASDFKNWEGSTGVDLPLDDEWVRDKTEYLLKIMKEIK